LSNVTPLNKIYGWIESLYYIDYMYKYWHKSKICDKSLTKKKWQKHAWVCVLLSSANAINI